MLIELQRSEFLKILPLLTGCQVNIEVKAIASGNNPGWIFVDNHNNPQTALVFSHGQGGFYFTGRVYNSAFEKALPQTIDKLQDPLARIGINYFEYSGTSTDWEVSLEKLFANKNYGQEIQRVYLLKKGETASKPFLKKPTACRVEEVTQTLLGDPQVNTSYIEKNILDWWDTLDEFCRLGKGYCVVCEGKAVSICLTSFVALDNEWGIGIYTHESYRERGLAGSTAVKLLEICGREGATAYWDCNDTNIPSRRLAESLGFCLLYKYWIYDFKLA